MLHLTQKNFVPQVNNIIAVSDMYTLAGGERTHIIFI